MPINMTQPGRILIVDDEPDICEYVKILLQEHQYEVSIAASGEEALGHLEKQEFDVLVTDIRMPGMSGIALIQKARRVRNSLQCIVITGHGDMDSAVMALRMGAAAYLEKPLDFSELVASVSLALEKARLIIQVEMQKQHLEQLVTERTQALKESNKQLLYEVEIRRKAEQKAYYQACHDYLTGLPNRFLLEDRLQTMVVSGKRHGAKFSVMVLDLDGFKKVNDSHGHGIGDKVLQTVADRLCDLLRESDTVVRMGGDEFLLLLPDTDNRNHATKVAKKISEVIASPMHLDKQLIHVGISIGIALYPDDGEDPDLLIKAADQEMYRRKQEKSHLP